MDDSIRSSTKHKARVVIVLRSRVGSAGWMERVVVVPLTFLAFRTPTTVRTKRLSE
jgi:hypothetical protein